jgi:hypothetical protein
VARGAWPEEINRRQLGAGDRPEARHDRQEEIGNRRPSSPRTPCCSRGSSPSGVGAAGGPRRAALGDPRRLRAAGHPCRCRAAADPQAIVTTSCCLRGSSPAGAAGRPCCAAEDPLVVVTAQYCFGGPRLGGRRPSSRRCRGPAGRIWQFMEYCIWKDKSQCTSHGWKEKHIEGNSDRSRGN